MHAAAVERGKACGGVGGFWFWLWGLKDNGLRLELRLGFEGWGLKEAKALWWAFWLGFEGFQGGDLKPSGQD